MAIRRATSLTFLETLEKGVFRKITATTQIQNRKATIYSVGYKEDNSSPLSWKFGRIL